MIKLYRLLFRQQIDTIENIFCNFSIHTIGELLQSHHFSLLCPYLNTIATSTSSNNSIMSQGHQVIGPSPRQVAQKTWAFTASMYASAIALNNPQQVAITLAFVGLYGSMIIPTPVFILLAPFIATTYPTFLSGLTNQFTHTQIDPDLSSATITYYANYFASVYLLFAITEWLIHKYIMHANIFWPWLTNNPHTYNPIFRYLKITCLRHKFHHVHTNADMTLAKFEDKYELILSWFTLVLFTTFTFTVLALAEPDKLALHAITTLALTLYGGYSWNTLHTDLHFPLGGASTDPILNTMTLTDGPSILPIPLPWFFYTNHIAHHVVKGIQKGNFNIIFLGADYIFGTYHELACEPLKAA